MHADDGASPADVYLDALERTRIGMALRARPTLAVVEEHDSLGMIRLARAELEDLSSLEDVCERQRHARCLDLVGPDMERLRTRLAAVDRSVAGESDSPDADEALTVQLAMVRSRLDLVLLTLLREHAHTGGEAARRVDCVVERVAAHAIFLELSVNPALHAGLEDPMEASGTPIPEHVAETARLRLHLARQARAHMADARAALAAGNNNDARRHAAEAVWLLWVTEVSTDGSMTRDEVAVYLDMLDEQINALVEETEQRAARAEALMALDGVDLPDGGELWLSDPAAAARAVQPTFERLAGPLSAMRTELEATAARAVEACAGVTLVAPHVGLSAGPSG